MASFSVEVDASADAQVRTGLATWLNDRGITDVTTSSDPPTLSAAEVTAVVVSSAGALTALLTALAAYTRARTTTIMVRARSGAAVAINGQVSEETLNRFVDSLSDGDIEPV